MKKIVWICVLIVWAVFLYMVSSEVILWNKEQAKFRSDTIFAVNELTDLVMGEGGACKPILMPSYLKCGAMVIQPNGSAYIPMVYKSKENLTTLNINPPEDWTTGDMSYYDIGKIYIKGNLKEIKK